MKRILPSALLLTVLLAACSAAPSQDASRAAASSSAASSAQSSSSAPAVALAVAPDIHAKVGVRFTIRLGSNATTGYSWSAAYNKDKLTLLSSRTISPVNTDGKVGAPGQQEFTFRPIAKGKTTITFVYQRPWEKVPAAQTREYSVNIQ